MAADARHGDGGPVTKEFVAVELSRTLISLRTGGESNAYNNITLIWKSLGAKKWHHVGRGDRKHIPAVAAAAASLLILSRYVSYTTL